MLLIAFNVAPLLKGPADTLHVLCVLETWLGFHSIQISCTPRIAQNVCELRNIAQFDRRENQGSIKQALRSDFILNV